jgi:hypothetical protein
MAGVFQNIDPLPPRRPAIVYPPPLVQGEDTLAGWRGGWGVNILEDARHSSVLYIRKYFVPYNYDMNLSPFPSDCDTSLRRARFSSGSLPLGAAALPSAPPLSPARRPIPTQ